MAQEDQINKRLSGRSAFAELLGIEIWQLGDGSCQCRLTVKDFMYNLNKVVHGGVVYTIADIAMGAALYTRLANDESCSTIEIKINYLKPTLAGEINCQANLVQKGRNFGVLEAEIKNGEILVAKALGTFAIFQQQ